jgi:sorbitol-6-phosphate 2-dehydrogenase
MSWLDLEGKVAIVTGGACGIGRAVCRGLAEVGAKIVVADIDEKGAGKTALDLKKEFGGEHIATKTDVTDKSSVEAMVAAALDAFGKVDILVNNAGILIPRLLVDPAGKEELTEGILFMRPGGLAGDD